MPVSRVRDHLRQNVVGYVALVVALVGVPTAWAVGKNTVGSKQLKPRAVKRADLAANAVTSRKVADRSLRGEDFARGEIPAGATGPQGPAGPTGATGPQGPAGSPDTAAQILAKLLTVDGAGSGLDADTVDGVGASAFGAGIMSARFVSPIADNQNRFPIGESSTASGPLPDAPETFVISDFEASVGTPPGAGQKWTFTVRENNTLTNVSCTISGGFSACNDGNDSVQIEAGNGYSIRIDSTGAPPNTAAVVDYLARRP